MQRRAAINLTWKNPKEGNGESLTRSGKDDMECGGSPPLSSELMSGN
jgi:hypothetical protein